MGLFFDLLNSINNPKQAGSLQDLGDFMASIHTAAHQQGVDSQTTQTVVSALSAPLRNVLQNEESSTEMIRNLSQVGADSTLSRLMAQFLGPNFLHGLAQKTGVQSSQLQGMIPIVIPALLKLFSMGKSSHSNGSNGILESFLGNDQADFGEVVKYSSRLLGQVI